MRAIDVHPDELFDREQQGLLSAGERARLSLHLAQCAACRLERQLVADFAGELTPSSQAASVHSVVLGALQAAQLPAAPVPAASSAPVAAAPSGGLLAGPLAAPSARSSRKPLWQAAAALALAMVLGAGVAAAQRGLLTRAFDDVSERLGWHAVRRRPTREAAAQAARIPSLGHTSQVTNDQPVAAAARGLPQTAPTPQIEQAAPVAVSQGSASNSSPIALVEPVKISRSASTSRVRGRRLLHTRPAQTRGIPSPSAPVIAHPPERAPVAATVGVPLVQEPRDELSANKLFELANAARHRGDVLEASGLYRELRGRYPDSAEARLSLAVVARMQLDRSEARSALLGFDAYLQSGDQALREEAMTGRALALERLGQSAEAARAFEALLQAFPRSLAGRAFHERQAKATP